jgi:hypothetical protein
MAPGNTPKEQFDKKPEAPPEPEKKPAPPEGDPLAELIDSYSEEIEPVPPTGEANRDTGETK